jgi:hypothetical protein
VGQASSLSVRDDRQDAGPASNLSFGGVRDCFAALAIAMSRPHVTEGLSNLSSVA